MLSITDNVCEKSFSLRAQKEPVDVELLRRQRTAYDQHKSKHSGHFTLWNFHFLAERIVESFVERELSKILGHNSIRQMLRLKECSFCVRISLANVSFVWCAIISSGDLSGLLDLMALCLRFKCVLTWSDSWLPFGPVDFCVVLKRLFSVALIMAS